MCRIGYRQNLCLRTAKAAIALILALSAVGTAAGALNDQSARESESSSIFPDGESCARHISSGKNFLEARDWESAREEFVQAVDESKDFPDIDVRKATSMTYLGRVLSAQHKFSQANEFLEKSAAIEKKTFGANSKEYAEVLAYLAIAQIYLGHGERGEELSVEASTINQSRGMTAQFIASELNNRACAFMGMKDWKRAIRLLDKAIALAPNYGLAYENRSTAKMLSGDQKGGESDALKAAEFEHKTGL